MSFNNGCGCFNAQGFNAQAQAQGQVSAQVSAPINVDSILQQLNGQQYSFEDQQQQQSSSSSKRCKKLTPQDLLDAIFQVQQQLNQLQSSIPADLSCSLASFVSGRNCNPIYNFTAAGPGTGLSASVSPNDFSGSIRCALFSLPSGNQLPVTIVIAGRNCFGVGNNCSTYLNALFVNTGSGYVLYFPGAGSVEGAFVPPALGIPAGSCFSSPFNEITHTS